MDNNINYSREIESLKKKNILERIGDGYLKNPKAYITKLIVGFLALMLIILTPTIVKNIKYSINNGKIKSYVQDVEKYKSDIANVEKYLSTNEGYYKEYDKYSTSIKQEYKDRDKLIKDVNAVNYKSKKFKDEFAVCTKNFDKEKADLKAIKSELEEVVSITNEQTSLSSNILVVSDKYNKELPDLNKVNTDILANGKNNRVKDKSKTFVSNYENSYKNISAKINDFTKITTNEKGKYTLTELRSIKQKNSYFADNYNGMLNQKSDYEKYYSLLLDQYFTIVTNNDYRRTSENVTESNPAFKEWTEQENYTDTETRYKTETENYTERVYKGSRVVGNTKEDIYENETKTRTKQVPYQVQVQKTRTVTKDNGQPRTIQVPYEVRYYYKEVKKTTPQGTTTDKIDLVKKHAKYDSLSYSFSGNDRVGYTEWKQKYNDEVLKGFNLNPHLE